MRVPMVMLPVLAAVLVGAACASAGSEPDGAAEPAATASSPEPSEPVTTEPVASADPTSAPTPTPQPTATSTPEPTPTPQPTTNPEPTPTPTPEPTGTPTPTPTPVDTTPVVVQGDGWAITEADVTRMVEFVETVHELEFTSTVLVESDDDIGANFVPDIELFPEDEFRLIVALGLVEPAMDRESLNQFRRDRIRGLCCVERNGSLAVVVEPRSTRLETEVILVHELVHALHRQHPELQGGPGPSGGFELPSPWVAALESVPQFVAFRYLETHSDDDRATVEPELPIASSISAEGIGDVPAAMLNFAYFTAVPMAEVVYEVRGASGLSDLLRRPPTTTEQVLYPQKWLRSEDRVSQASPELPADARFIDEGRLGVVMLGYLIDEVASAEQQRALLSQWTGDRWSLYRMPNGSGADCIAAVVQMDTPAAAAELADLVGEALDQALTADDQQRIRFDTCAR